MEDVVILPIRGKKVVVNVSLENRSTNKIYTVYGHFNVVRRRYSINELFFTLSGAFSQEYIDKLYSEPLIGKDYVDVLGERKKLIVLSEGQVRTSPDDFVVYTKDEIETKLKKLAKDIYLSRIRYYERIMNIPIEHSLKVTKMRRALGKNYTTKHLITLDKNLIHFSIPLIDQVVVHELAHYFEQNHSKRFYNIVYKYLPDYDKLREKIIFGYRK